MLPDDTFGVYAGGFGHIILSFQGRAASDLNSRGVSCVCETSFHDAGSSMLGGTYPAATATLTDSVATKLSNLIATYFFTFTRVLVRESSC